MRECWPTLNIKKNHPVTDIREGWMIPNSKIALKGFSLLMFNSIPELLAQADMVRMATYSYDRNFPGILVRPKRWAESLRRTLVDRAMWEYPYKKPHTYHKLQPPKGDMVNPGVAG